MSIYSPTAINEETTQNMLWFVIKLYVVSTENRRGKRKEKVISSRCHVLGHQIG